MKKSIMKHLITILLTLLICSEIHAEGKYYGLFIAIDQYEDRTWENINHATRDAEAIRNILEQQYHFEVSVNLYNEMATKEQMVNTINLITQQIEQDDHLVIFYSGHSRMLKEESAWIPYDANPTNVTSFIKSSKIHIALKASNKGQILIFSDALLKGKFSKTASGIPKESDAAYYNKMRKLTARQVMSSTALSPMIKDGEQHSIFVKYLTKFLKENDKAELDINELFQTAKYAIHSNSDYSPILTYLQDTGHEGGQFVFRKAMIPFKKANDGIAIPTSFEYSKPVTIEEDVDVMIEKGDDIEFTHKGTITAKASSKGVLYSWYRNGFLVGEQASLEVKVSGIYTVKVLSRTGVELASTKTRVTVKERKYVVKIGDNLERIATLFYGNSDKAKLIQKANGFGEDILLKVGTSLIIPNDVEDIIANSKNLIVAGEDHLAPFSGKDLYNQGMLAEVINRVFDEMGLTCRTDFMDLNHAKAAVIEGQTFGVYPTLKNPQDEANFLYSAPIYKVSNVLFERKGSETDFSKPSKLRGKVVAVKRGYDIAELMELYKKKHIQLYPCRTLEECFELLEKGEVDLVATSQFIGLSYLKESGKKMHKFNVIEQPLGFNTLHFAVSKSFEGAEQIIEDFNNNYSRLKFRKVISDIQNRHVDKIQEEE